MTDWGDVVARCRGLASRLSGPPAWRALCASADLEGLRAQLSALGVIVAAAPGTPTTPEQLELALRRRAGARLLILAAWAGARVGALAPLFHEEDRRSLRGIVRGAVGGVAPGERVSGLIATPALPMRALDQLARAADLPAIVALLTVWRHPFAPALAVEAGRAHPDLFRLDAALTTAFAARAVAAARRADGPMRRFVATTIDLQNLWTALALAESAFDGDAGTLFTAGGTIVTADDVRRAAESRSVAVVTASLRPRAARTVVAAALDADSSTREGAALAALTAEFRKVTRREPLSTAPIIAFVLRQRVELRALLRITWGIALGASPKHLESVLEAAA